MIYINDHEMNLKTPGKAGVGVSKLYIFNILQNIQTGSSSSSRSAW